MKRSSKRKRGRRRERAPIDPAARFEALLTPRAERAVTVLLLAVMAVFRLAYLHEFGKYASKAGDAEFFLELARRIAAGDVFLQGESLVFSPLYYYFLGGLFAIFGEAYTVVLGAQFLLGIAGGWLLYRLARDLFGPLAALTTFALFAFYGIALVYEGQLMDASFSVFLPVAGLTLLHRAQTGGGLRVWIGAGAVLGLFALTRPNVMLFFPVALLWAFWVERDTERQRLARVAALAFGMALCLVPFGVRNRVVTGETVLVTAHGGINFYVGNNPQATGFFTPPAGMPPLPGVFNREVPRAVAERETGVTGMSDSEVSRYWFGRGVDFLRENPGRGVDLTLRKARAFFNAREVPINVDFEFYREISPVLRAAFVPFGLVLPLGLVGMFLARDRWRVHLVFWLFFATYSVSVILFFITARYRLPVVPVLLLYAGFAVRELVARTGRPVRLVAPGIALAALLFAVNTELPLRINPAHVAHSRGYTLQTMEREDEAIAYYEEALRLDSRLVLTHLQLARIYARRGSLALADRHYRAAARIAPNDESIQAEWRPVREHVQGLEPPVP